MTPASPARARAYSKLQMSPVSDLSSAPTPPSEVDKWLRDAEAPDAHAQLSASDHQLLLLCEPAIAALPSAALPDALSEPDAPDVDASPPHAELFATLADLYDVNACSMAFRHHDLDSSHVQRRPPSASSRSSPRRATADAHARARQEADRDAASPSDTSPEIGPMDAHPSLLSSPATSSGKPHAIAARTRRPRRPAKRSARERDAARSKRSKSATRELDAAARGKTRSTSRLERKARQTVPVAAIVECDERNMPVRERCIRCDTRAAETPMMRKGPDGCRSLCNACGLKWSRHGVY